MLYFKKPFIKRFDKFKLNLKYKLILIEKLWIDSPQRLVELKMETNFTELENFK